MKGNLILISGWASLGALLPVRDLISHLPEGRERFPGKWSQLAQVNNMEAWDKGSSLRRVQSRLHTATQA